MVTRRTALERLWKDRCRVEIRTEETDPDTKITDFLQTVLLEDQPCKLSFESVTAAKKGGVAVISQSVKLFLTPEVTIPPGSKITVTRPSGAVTQYFQSGCPAVFTNHQEIRLELFKGWA